ncbi:MAG: hypothetical protein NVS1B7_0060 [Candidatus Saccharimonadales bacterium]
MKLTLSPNADGFTLVEIVLASVIFPIVVIGIANAFDGVRLSYSKARQLNEVYAVLSACPEIDRGLEYDSVTSTTNCYPNTAFQAENGSTNTITYSPTVSVTATSALPLTDPLQPVFDSKAIDIKVGFPNNPAQPLELRMLVTRNGIGQL